MIDLLQRPATRHEQLVDELKTLRKGRGIHTSRVDERIGTCLREVSGVLVGEGPVAIRSKVEAHLALLARFLPADLRTAVLIAFGIAPESRHPFYKDRVSLAAQRIDRDPRTARRRIDEAIERLAELAVAPGHLLGEPVVGTGWHITKLVLSATIDRGGVQLIELCRLAADDGLPHEVPLLSSHLLTNATTEVHYGGDLVGRGRLALTTPPDHGEAHEYLVRAHCGPGGLAHPGVHITPAVRCDEFHLHVRFADGLVPRGLHRIDDGSGHEHAHHAVEQHLQFDFLTPGQTYGLRWNP